MKALSRTTDEGRFGLLGILALAVFVGMTSTAIALDFNYSKNTGNGVGWRLGVQGAGPSNNSAGGPHNIKLESGIYQLGSMLNGANYQSLGLHNLAGGTVANPTVISGGWDGTLSAQTLGSTIINCGGNARAFAVFVDNVVIDNIVFTNMTAVNYPHESPNLDNNDIAGVYVDGDNVTITRCVFRNNVSFTGGRPTAFGKRTSGSRANNLTVEDTDFTNWNDAAEGKFLRMIDGVSFKGVTLTDIDLLGYYSFGGISGDSGAYLVTGFSIEDSEISDSDFGKNSGCIEAPAAIRRCFFLNNNLNRSEGTTSVIRGIFNQPTSVVENCCLSGNKHRAVYQPYSASPDSFTTELVNCTIINTQSGTGVYSNGGTYLLTNCIVDSAWGLAAATPGKGIIEANSSMVNRTPGTGGYIGGTGNIPYNPTFLAGGLAGELDPASDGVDAGDNDAAPATDIVGVCRPSSGTADIGAFEVSDCVASAALTSICSAAQAVPPASTQEVCEAIDDYLAGIMACDTDACRQQILALIPGLDCP